MHAQEFGWLGWAKNERVQGHPGYSYRLEAIEVKLVEKGIKYTGCIQTKICKLSDTCSRYWMARNKI